MCFFVLRSRRFQNRGGREVGWQRLGDTRSSACLAQSLSQIITSGLLDWIQDGVNDRILEVTKGKTDRDKATKR